MTQSDVLIPPTTDGHRVHRLVGGTELLGQYQDSAYEEPRYLIKRADGQVMQLPGLLYRVAASLDGRGTTEIAEELSSEFGRELTADQITFLVEDRLRPVGLIARPDVDDDQADDGVPPPAPVRSDPLLALRYRVGVLPASVAWRIGGLFGPLFRRPAWLLLLGSFVAADAWIASRGNLLGHIVAGVEDVARRPGLVLAILALTVLSAAFHECGHVTACRYGGGRPGDIGIGLYIIWPAFYSTVTDSYRLSRVGRLRTDLGGIYFNAVFMLGLGVVYLRTGEPWLIIALIGMHVETAWQFLPSLRLDGYYILADLVGVPDLFGYVKPVLLSALPRRPTHPLVRQLKPRARRIVLLWVLLVVPTLTFWMVAFLIAAPRLLPAAWRATSEYLTGLDAVARSGDVVATTVGVFQLLLLALPWVGTALILGSLVRLLARRLIAPRLPDRRGSAAWTRVRQDLVVVVVIGIGALLVARVRAVALTHPGTRDELRLVDSALAGVRHTNGPSAGGGDLLARAQLIGYARLTGAFDRSGTALGAGRELAVLAAAVLVFCLLALAAARRLPPAAVGLPMLAVLVMGPAAITFATVGPGLIGAAWAASGALVLAFARGRPAAVLGVLALVVAVATEPLTAVPLAVGTAVQLGSGRIRGRRSGRHHPPPSSLARRFFLRSPRWLPAALLVVAGIAGVLGGGGGGASVPVDGSEATVLVLLGALLVVAGALVRHLRPVAAATGSALILAVLPWPGAGSALPLAAAAMVLLGTCLTDALIGVPVDQRAHPLVRAALAVPALVLVLVGALFQPSSTGPDATAAAASSATAAVVGR